MRIIDFHAHVYPQQIAIKATKSIGEFYSIKGAGMNGTVDQLLDLGGKAGIEKYVLLPVAMKQEHVRSINNFTLVTKEEHEEFFAFATVHASMPDMEEEIEYIFNNDFKGIKLHPDIQRFNIDDERLFPLYESVRGKLPVLFHCGDKNFDYSNPKRLRKVLDMFPNLQAIAAHLGGWSMWEEAHEALKDTDCYFDISSCLMFMKDTDFKKYINSYGSERILYGDDYPIWSPLEEVDRFMQLNISDSDRENIAYKNALRILKI